MGKKKTKIRHANIVERFAARLRELRIARGLRQADVAKAAATTTSYVTRLEAGGAAPGIDLVARLAEALETTVQDLLAEDVVVDEEAVFRRRAQTLFDDLMKSADKETLSMVVPLLARLNESPTRKR